MKRVRLKKDVRVFEKSGTGSLLCRTGMFLKRDEQIEIDEPETVCYDHMDKMAVSFQLANNKGYYLLCEELVYDVVPIAIYEGGMP